MNQKTGSDRSELRAERNRFVGFAFAAGDLLLEVDDEGLIRFATGAGCGVIGGPVSGLCDKPLVGIVNPDDRGFMRELLRALRAQGRLGPTRVRLQSIHGKTIDALLGGCRLPSAPDRSYLSLAMGARPSGGVPEPQDNTYHLHNRAEFTEMAQDRLRSASRMGLDHQMTMVLVQGMERLRAELDDETAGDLLGEISAFLRAVSLGGDSAGLFDGEHLSVVHDGAIEPDQIAERLREVISRTTGQEAPPVQTFSLDLDVGDMNEDDAVRALVYSVRKFADDNRREAFTISSLHDGAQAIMDDALSRVGELRNTIERRAFDVVFQPIVEMDSGRVHHFEALSRLVGIASPAAFINFAEEIGLIEDFDLAVCQKVMDDLANQAGAGFTPSVAMNISARSLNSDLFIDNLRQILEPYPDQRKQLMLELTETVLVSDFDRLNNVLQSFRNAGHTVCLDDVGAGGTSFQSLYNLGVDFAKIDGQFVRNAISNPRDMSILRGIVQVCQELKMGVIAEQIEEEAQARAMAELGIKFGQGFLFGRPMLDYRVRYGRALPPANNAPARRRGVTEEWR